tara:strand:+ start:887 stop:1915 length:1029 start_codon:yes stop_codon:yes gene_type:complete
MNTHTYTQQFDSSCWSYIGEDSEQTFICGDFTDLKTSGANGLSQPAPSLAVDMTLLITASLIFGPMLASVFKIMCPDVWRIVSSKLSGKRTVTIVRGVPGVGKRHYVYNQEKNKKGLFGICDWNDYFKDNEGNHSFDGTMISRAENFSKMAFLDYLSREVDRIYVLGYFSEIWSYSEYETLAKMNGYNIKIVELKCQDVDHLRHYNKRSSHKVPMAKSKKVFENWEVDPDSVYQEPYLENFPGDCIPKYGTVNVEELDKQLHDYNLRAREIKQAKEMSKEDKHDSESEYDPDEDEVDSQDSDNESNDDFNSYTPEYTDYLVELVTQELIDQLQSREVCYTVV